MPMCKKPHALLLVFTLAVTTGCSEGAPTRAVESADAVRLRAASADAVLTQLKQAAVPLRTSEPGGATGDLAALGAAIGAAHVVGLGEATHGTHEFFRMKHRLFEYLVKERGFTVFAIEGHRYVAERLNRYVQTGSGDPRAILATEATTTWHMEEILELVGWMRRYNRTRGKSPALVYTSFDLQHPVAEKQAVLTYLERSAPQQAEAAARAYDFTSLSQGTAQEKAEQVRAIRAVERSVRSADARVRHFAAVVSRSAEVLQHAPQSADDPNLVTYFNLRDEGMADNVMWLAQQEHPGAKIALWAHNGHVGSFKNYAGHKGATTMGQHLRGRLGAGYFRLAFSFDHGAATAQPGFGRPFEPITLAPARSGSLDHQMHQVGEPRFFVNLQAPPSASALGRWLRAVHPMRSIGYVIPPGADEALYMPTDAQEAFDGLIHIEKSTPARHYGLPPSGGFRSLEQITLPTMII